MINNDLPGKLVWYEYTNNQDIPTDEYILFEVNSNTCKYQTGIFTTSAAGMTMGLIGGRNRDPSTLVKWASIKHLLKLSIHC